MTNSPNTLFRKGEEGIFQFEDKVTRNVTVGVGTKASESSLI
jgi:hypothetical protein